MLNACSEYIYKYSLIKNKSCLIWTKFSYYIFLEFRKPSTFMIFTISNRIMIGLNSSGFGVLGWTLFRATSLALNNSFRESILLRSFDQRSFNILESLVKADWSRSNISEKRSKLIAFPVASLESKLATSSSSSGGSSGKGRFPAYWVNLSESCISFKTSISVEATFLGSVMTSPFSPRTLFTMLPSLFSYRWYLQQECSFSQK